MNQPLKTADRASLVAKSREKRLEGRFIRIFRECREEFCPSGHRKRRNNRITCESVGAMWDNQCSGRVKHLNIRHGFLEMPKLCPRTNRRAGIAILVRWKFHGCRQVVTDLVMRIFQNQKFCECLAEASQTRIKQ